MPAKSTTSRSRRKRARPGKPRPDYPLFAHASGRWARKLKLNDKWVLRYLGRWGTMQGGEVVPVENVAASAAAALDEFNRQWPYLTGLMPPPPPDPEQDDDESVPTLANVCNAFLRSKRAAMQLEELSPRTYRDYERPTDWLSISGSCGASMT